jgi:hypothetical protein
LGGQQTWLSALSQLPERALIAISKSQSFTATVLINELDPACFEGSPDGKQGAGMGGACAAHKVDDGALGDHWGIEPSVGTANSA